ncbi:MAG: phosphotransferase [Candidatus Thiodiazotropha sp.]
MITTEALCELMPHAGSMCLIQELVSWDKEQIVCRTRSHLSAQNPLRSGGRLNAIHAIEYGAQAIGLHGGLLAKQSGENPGSGLLVGLRQIRLHRTRLDDTTDPLLIHARRLLADSRNLLYAFAIHLNQEPVAEGRAAIITQQGVES